MSPRRKFAGGVRRVAKAAKIARKAGPTMIQRSLSIGASEKAAFHQVSGAGKSHVKREFFGLSAADEQAIVDRVGQALDQVVKEA